jgi:hypothetical protein
MPNRKIPHNANLLINLPQNRPVVNYVDRSHDSGSDYQVENAPSKLFVRVANSIFQFRLKPRLLEFYCLLSYLVFANPGIKLPILTIQELILSYTNIKLSKNTINNYINKLLELKLISCNKGIYSVTNSNPKGNYTIFYITHYNMNAKFGSAGLEFYMASKIYSNHRPSKVCTELNISPKTYYKYLNDLLSKLYITKTVINYKLNYYKNSYRKILWEDYIQIKDTRFYEQQYIWSQKRQNKLLARKKVRELNGEIVTPTTFLNAAKSRLWFASPMKRIMKEYKINYIRAFDNYDADDAYKIVTELVEQYRKSGQKLNAAIIVKGILNSFNWIKIQDREHLKLKRELRNKEIKMSYGENYVDHMMNYD